MATTAQDDQDVHWGAVAVDFREFRVVGNEQRDYNDLEARMLASRL